MDNQIIEPNPELRFTLIASPDDPPLFSTEYQRILRDLSHALQSEGLELTCRFATHDAIGAGGGLSGEFALVATSVGLLIRQLARVLDKFLDARHGRKIKVQIGTFKVEGGSSDVDKILAKLVSSQEFQKLLEHKGTKKKKRPSH